MCAPNVPLPISFGLYRSTAEIESSLVAHPCCAEAAVAAVPCDVKGNDIFAFVLLKDEWDGSAAFEGMDERQRNQALAKALRMEIALLQSWFFEFRK